MKVTRLYTYWSTGEAHAVIEFLNVLRDQLWEEYGDDIIASLITDQPCSDEDHQMPLPSLPEEI